MAQDALPLASPIGRLVRGSLTEREKEDYDGNAYPEGEGPFELGFAILKTEPTLGDFLGKIFNHAIAGYANNSTIQDRIKAEWSSGFTIGAFRFKIRDGDKPNQKGQLNSNTKGCFVLNLASYYPVQTTYTDRHGLPKFTDVMGKVIEPGTALDAKLINIGDYGYLSLSTKVNEKTDHTAGVYLNSHAVMLAARGEKITGGVDLATAFAGVNFGQLPSGASVNVAPGATGGAPVGGLPGGTVPNGNPGNPGQTPNATLPTTSPSNVGGLPGVGAGDSTPNGFPGVTPHAGFVPGGLPGQ